MRMGVELSWKLNESEILLLRMFMVSHGSQKTDRRRFLDDQQTLTLWPLVNPQPLLIAPF